MKDGAMCNVLVMMGSNVAREENLPRAVAALRTHPRLTVRAVSAVFETPPIGCGGEVTAQPTFYNAAVLLETDLAPQELRLALRTIEAELGRVRSPDKFAPRPIDLDIALYGNQILTTPELTIPDPDIVRFLHVALPLADIAPTWRHPTDGRQLAAIAAELVAAAGKVIGIKKVETQIEERNQ